ncbi:MAG: LLM class flavin-dependent oxidoreductase [Micromonosporaceae bacterium]
MDYGRPLEFGYFLVPEAPDFSRLHRLAQRADDTGLDFVAIQDHPYHRRHFDTWTLLTALAAQTSRIRYVTDVANLPLRPPAVLAKAAASLDVITGGRVELGLGAGGQWDAVTAMGGPRRTPGESIAALSEAIDVIRQVWSGERGRRYDGTHYRLDGLNPGPVPAHPIGIWLGAYRPKMLALTGEKADGWVPSSAYLPPEKLADGHGRIDDAARAAGREPDGIRRAYNLMGSFDDQPRGFLNGPTDQWIDELTELATGYGVDTFLLSTSGDPVHDIGIFAEEVAPAVRAAVARERAGSVPVS